MNSFPPIVDLIPLFFLCPPPEEEPPTLDPCLVLSLGSPPPYALPLLSVDPLPKENPFLLEFCPSSLSGYLPRDDLFLPDSCTSPFLCDLCLPYLPHPNAPDLEEDLYILVIHLRDASWSPRS
uniref:Orf122a n=1 Tax=Batis maritima TaxID=4436 RepID=A0A068BF69_BATMA|nr:orf122a [Batis maritima]AIC83349.1 orf122a [Batis maritima]